MINREAMIELSAKAQDKFPLTQEQATILHFTGDRNCVIGLCEERILWMLNQAFEIGKNKK